MSTAPQITIDQLRVDELAGTVADIHCDEKSAEDWTRQISREVMAALTEFYSEVSEQAVEHIVCETLFKISLHLRQGHPVTLESLGSLLPVLYGGRERAVAFYPCPGLFRPVPGATPTVIWVPDRRRGVRHG